jgi:cytochrome c-type biogenesis protein
MTSYRFGYTLIIFLVSLFTGLSKQLNFLKYNGQKVTRFASFILAITGLWSFYQGIIWFI